MTTRRRADLATGKRLRAARKKAKMTIQELSDASGWSHGLIGLIELGQRTPSPHVLRDLAQAMGVPITDIRKPALICTRVGPRVVGAPYLSGWEVVEEGV